MILIDTKGKETQELLPHIQAQRVPVEATDLPYGDAAFEGSGPDGIMAVGIERKKLHDMLACIDDSRYSAHQRLGMSQLYRVSFLVIEGYWRPHDPGGMLMEGYSGGMSWGYAKHRSAKILYSKLRRYLFSVTLSGVHVIYTRDPFHTAFDICELYHYFQKPWRNHTSMLEMQKLSLPAINLKPPLVRKWAADIDGVGVKLSEDAERLFKTPIRLASSDEMDWLKIRGIGVPTAQDIVRQIGGKR